MIFVQTGAGDFELRRPVGAACDVLLDPRVLIEMAAELDPDTYVPILDLLDEDELDLEDDEIESVPVECWFEPSDRSGWIPVYERCPCCGNIKHEGEYTQ